MCPHTPTLDKSQVRVRCGSVKMKGGRKELLIITDCTSSDKVDPTHILSGPFLMVSR